jgi:hypothetical protein
MQQRVEKTRPKGGTPKSTLDPAAQTDPELTARMHFYVVRSTGDQLRWASAQRKGKKPDRMVGR